MSKKISWLKIIAIICVVGYLVSIIPLLYASFYAHSILDDFGYSKLVHYAVENHGNILDILKASFEQVRQTYLDWQGTFSAIFVFSLQPGAFSEDLYFLTTFIMIFSITFSTYFLLDTIIVQLCKSKKSYSIIVSSLVLFCEIQFMVDVRQGLYWYNGSSYYTLFYSASLFFFGALVRMMLSVKTTNRILWFALTCLLSIFIGGGNYSTVLCTICISFLILFFSTLRKQKNLYLLYIIFFVLATSFVISIAAPGNAVRAESLSGQNPFQAIINSIILSMQYIGSWIKLPQFVLFAFITPIIQRITKNINFNFKLPLLSFVISLLCFATQLTPPLYAMSNVGEGRQINIYYFSFYLFVIYNIFYFCGWLNSNDFIKIDFIKISDSKHFVSAIALVAICFLMGCSANINEMSSVKATSCILNGSAWQYETEYNEIINKIKTNQNDITNISSCPPLYMNFFFEENAENWTNKQVADYYSSEYFSAKIY